MESETHARNFYQRLRVQLRGHFRAPHASRSALPRFAGFPASRLHGFDENFGRDNAEKQVLTSRVHVDLPRKLSGFMASVVVEGYIDSPMHLACNTDSVDPRSALSSMRDLTHNLLSVILYATIQRISGSWPPGSSRWPIHNLTQCHPMGQVGSDT